MCLIYYPALACRPFDIRGSSLESHRKPEQVGSICDLRQISAISASSKSANSTGRCMDVYVHFSAMLLFHKMACLTLNIHALEFFAGKNIKL